MRVGKQLAAMLVAGVTPEVNPRECISHIPLPSAKKLPSLTLTPRGDITRSPKQGYQWPHRKDLCPPKKIKKKKQTGNCFLGLKLVLGHILLSLLV